MSHLSLHEEAEDCRRKALTYVGMPEGPFLLRLANAFDQLAVNVGQTTADGSTSYAGRKVDRVHVDAWLFMRRVGEVKFQTHICNISPEGCMLVVASRPRIGDRVWVKIEGVEALEGTVCWMTGNNCGLQFSVPLHPVVFSSIMANYERRRSAGSAGDHRAAASPYTQ